MDRVARRSLRELALILKSISDPALIKLLTKLDPRVIESLRLVMQSAGITTATEETNLRRRVIRLAYEDRSLRSHLLPLIKGMSRRVYGFNKENPTELISQTIRVLDKAADETEGDVRKGLQDAASRVKGIAKDVNKAWAGRRKR